MNPRRFFFSAAAASAVFFFCCCCVAAASSSSSSSSSPPPEFSRIDNFDVGCDVEGKYECKNYGILYIDDEFIETVSRPTIEIFESNAHAFLYTIEYPNLNPDLSSYSTVSGGGDGDGRALVVEASGPNYSDAAICAWEIPVEGAAVEGATAYCHDTHDKTMSKLRFVGDGCATFLMNAGEADVPGESEAPSDYPFSATYECHRI